MIEFNYQKKNRLGMSDLIDKNNGLYLLLNKNNILIKKFLYKIHKIKFRRYLSF
jgi:hypothetical protein